ncbi:MAG TPA: hypothetical protein VJI97_02835 [Candidatus Nanoarchaeia archaeon]|nr:hypothetical protein [Candidatus Nanoarchaeia archaeon]
MEELEECEEPGCTEIVTKDWEGRKVCADHYDMYRDREDKIIQEA